MATSFSPEQHPTKRRNEMTESSTETTELSEARMQRLIDKLPIMAKAIALRQAVDVLGCGVDLLDDLEEAIPQEIQGHQRDKVLGDLGSLVNDELNEIIELLQQALDELTLNMFLSLLVSMGVEEVEVSD
jgi:hypothetical protein